MLDNIILFKIISLTSPHRYIRNYFFFLSYLSAAHHRNILRCAGVPLYRSYPVYHTVAPFSPCRWYHCWHAAPARPPLSTKLFGHVCWTPRHFVWTRHVRPVVFILGRRKRGRKSSACRFSLLPCKTRVFRVSSSSFVGIVAVCLSVSALSSKRPPSSRVSPTAVQPIFVFDRRSKCCTVPPRWCSRKFF